MRHVLEYHWMGNRASYKYREELAREPTESLSIVFYFLGGWPNAFMAMDHISSSFKNSRIPWLAPSSGGYLLDLDRLRQGVDELANVGWLHSTIVLDPQIEGYESDELVMTCEITPIKIRMQIQDTALPPEIMQSMERFYEDYPDPSRMVFIMMRYGRTAAHSGIVAAIKTTLKRLDLVGLRADDKQYHDMTFPNIMTYMHGCGFGIAVFERIETEEFNPNVALEVGYMKALKKPVCLLKDQTLRALQTDLGGYLYHSFDPQNIGDSINGELSRWLQDNGVG